MIKTKRQSTLLFALALACFASPVAARGVYLPPAEFIQASFGQTDKKPKVLWLSAEIQKSIKTILGHNYPTLRLRYWQEQQRTAWILEEIGKEKPITFGIVVNENKIEQLNVLIFRESRGGEIRYPFFTKQFKNLALNQRMELNGHIDGISGATLSVRASKKLARLALYLHNQVTGPP